MKLNKDICIRCINKTPYLYWRIWNDKRLNDGNIICSYKYALKSNSDEIPNKCPYKLEHIVNQ